MFKRIREWAKDLLVEVAAKAKQELAVPTVRCFLVGFIVGLLVALIIL